MKGISFPALILYVCSFFLHLTARVPSLGAMRLDLVLGLTTLLLIFVEPGGNKFRFNEKVGSAFTRFLLYIFISLPLVTWPGSVINNIIQDWLRVALFYLLVVGAVRTEKQLFVLIMTFLACQLFRVLEPLYLHQTTGYWGSAAFSHVDGVMVGLNRLSGAPSDIVNPNQLAWVIVTSIIFIFYMFWQAGGWGKIFSGILLAPCCMALLLTGSRSGLLSAGAAVVGMVLLSEKKGRNMVLTLVVVVPLGLFMIGLLAPDMQTRYLSLVDDSVAGADTAQGRTNALVRQIGSISNNPVFGNGLGTSCETNWNVMGGSSQITHDLYIEILQETGLIGLTLFVLYIAAIVKTLRQARQELFAKGIGNGDRQVRLITATLAWTMMDLFYSLSCFGLRSWEWYFFGGVAIVSSAVAEARSPAPLIPVARPQSGRRRREYQPSL